MKLSVFKQIVDDLKQSIIRSNERTLIDLHLSINDLKKEIEILKSLKTDYDFKRELRNELVKMRSKGTTEIDQFIYSESLRQQ